MFSFLFRSKGHTLTPQEVEALLAKGEIHLIDVREASEWHSGHITGARHIALSALPQEAAHLPKDKPVVFYCRSGARSGNAIGLCRKLGLPHESHMPGGILAWEREGRAISR